MIEEFDKHRMEERTDFKQFNHVDMFAFNLRHKSSSPEARDISWENDKGNYNTVIRYSKNIDGTYYVEECHNGEWSTTYLYDKNDRTNTMYLDDVESKQYSFLQAIIKNEQLLISRMSNKTAYNYGSSGKSNTTIAISNSLLSVMAILPQSRNSFINDAIRYRLKSLNIAINE